MWCGPGCTLLWRTPVWSLKGLAQVLQGMTTGVLPLLQPLTVFYPAHSLVRGRADYLPRAWVSSILCNDYSQTARFIPRQHL